LKRKRDLRAPESSGALFINQAWNVKRANFSGNWPFFGSGSPVETLSKTRLCTILAS
jgi:hypothetical protein